jgi:hypothetical protein
MIGRTREERKMAALLREQLSLKHACERIDHAEDVVKPQLEEMRELAKTQRLALEVSPEDVGSTT